MGENERETKMTSISARDESDISFLRRLSTKFTWPILSGLKCFLLVPVPRMM
jgi:hypothetical protein